MPSWRRRSPAWHHPRPAAGGAGEGRRAGLRWAAQVLTGWTCAGLVKHLALDVERFWFRQVMTGEQVEPDEFSDDGWQVRPDVSSTAVLDLYRQEMKLADKIITATSLDVPPAWWPGFFAPSFHLVNLRQVLPHVIAETACHAGHLDAARELIDGQTWLILT